jgi:hypothetical protein
LAIIRVAPSTPLLTMGEEPEKAKTFLTNDETAGTFRTEITRAASPP